MCKAAVSNGCFIYFMIICKGIERSPALYRLRDFGCGEASKASLQIVIALKKTINNLVPHTMFKMVF